MTHEEGLGSDPNSDLLVQVWYEFQRENEVKKGEISREDEVL
jgi:hypothetical protein